MKGFKYVVPNLFTLTGLLLGIVAIIVVFRGQNEYAAAWFIFGAALFDFLDGFVARLLNAQSEFGKNLDSLADMISFGVAPTIILFQWLYVVLTKLSAESTFELSTATNSQKIILLFSLLFAVGGAIRLARFTAQKNHSRDFAGLPIPAAALFIASFWLVLGGTESEGTRGVLLNLYFVLSTIVILFALMVSNLRVISLKFKGTSFKENTFQYILLIISLLLILVFQVPGIIFSLVIYVLLSLIYNFLPLKD